MTQDILDRIHKDFLETQEASLTDQWFIMSN